MLLANGLNFNTYTISEYAEESVENLKSEGLKSIQLDAMDIGLPDNSFDLVFCADVLHHVPDPEKMIKEMLRVSKRYVYLFEANGASIIRKIGERSESAKALGEKSYLPRRYSDFFKKCGYTPEIKPFYFFVPPHLKMKYIKLFKAISVIGEKVPLLRWQSQSVEIFLDKEK